MKSSSTRLAFKEDRFGVGFRELCYRLSLTDGLKKVLFRVTQGGILLFNVIVVIQSIIGAESAVLRNGVLEPLPSTNVCPDDSWTSTNMHSRCYKTVFFEETSTRFRLPPSSRSSTPSRREGSWIEGMQACLNQGGVLATIHDQEEDRLAHALTDNIASPCWLGLRRYLLKRPERGWIWVDSSNALDSKNFVSWGEKLKVLWRIVPPEEKCGQIDNDGWGQLPCWGLNAKLKCAVCATQSYRSLQNLSLQAYMRSFDLSNLWQHPPSPTSSSNIRYGSITEGSTASHTLADESYREVSRWKPLNLETVPVSSNKQLFWVDEPAQSWVEEVAEETEKFSKIHVQSLPKKTVPENYESAHSSTKEATSDDPETVASDAVSGGQGGGEHEDLLSGFKTEALAHVPPELPMDFFQKSGYDDSQTEKEISSDGQEDITILADGLSTPASPVIVEEIEEPLDGLSTGYQHETAIEAKSIRVIDHEVELNDSIVADGSNEPWEWIQLPQTKNPMEVESTTGVTVDSGKETDKIESERIDTIATPVGVDNLDKIEDVQLYEDSEGVFGMDRTVEEKSHQESENVLGYDRAMLPARQVSWTVISASVILAVLAIFVCGGGLIGIWVYRRVREQNEQKALPTVDARPDSSDAASLSSSECADECNALTGGNAMGAQRGF